MKLADRWLTLYDVDNLRIGARLVTLSGCQTGQQAVAPGDDLINLARGFFAAGASQLVASLWMVNNESTSRFMDHFYTALSRDRSAAAALQSAATALRQRYPHPYY